MGNEVLTFLHITIFSKKKATFWENWGKKLFEGHTIFYEKGSSYAKNEYNLFNQKLGRKYFHVT